MRACYLVALVMLIIGLCNGPASAQPAVKKAKSPANAQEDQALSPFGRPEGSIVDQTARYYVWYDGKTWHLRTTAKVGRNFSGTIRLKDAKIKSCLSIGLKNDNQKKGSLDEWRINADRNELKFMFKTSKLSDGFDFVVDGDEGQIEFELLIDTQKNPRAVFIGRNQEHPSKNPFALPAAPTRPK